MRGKVLILTGTFFVTILCLHSTWPVWCQSRPELTIQSESAVLMDGTTGQILFKKNPEKQFSPASLIKMMTLYLAFDAIKRGTVKFDQEVLVSKRAWKMGGSQMFLEVGDRVKFIELIKGVATISANDGALAIAEFLTGSEEVFVHQMNEKARALGLKHTRFVNSHGLHAKGQQTSAIDMASLGFHYIDQPLLKRDKSVDGLKTGYLRRAGYHFLFSAKKDSQRLIGIVMGAKTAESRDGDALKLIGYGFKNFSTLTVVKEGEVVGKVKVPNGDLPELGLSATKTLIVTVNKTVEESISLRKEIPPSANPPISKGDILGKLVLEGEGFSREEIDLVASQDVLPKSYTKYYVLGSAAMVSLLVFFYWRRRVPRKKPKKRRR